MSRSHLRAKPFSYLNLSSPRTTPDEKIFFFLKKNLSLLLSYIVACNFKIILNGCQRGFGVES